MFMSSSNFRRLSIVALGAIAVSPVLPLALQAEPGPSREIVVNLNESAGPVDRFFDLSVGSDYPGTLIRDDSQAQLKTASDELGFRYVRFHAIFHDVLGTVRVVSTTPHEAVAQPVNRMLAPVQQGDKVASKIAGH